LFVVRETPGFGREEELARQIANLLSGATPPGKRFLRHPAHAP
jgi:hypothetical protein